MVRKTVHIDGKKVTRKIKDDKPETLECPRCGSKMSGVLQTRHLHHQGIHMIVRVRQCRRCEKQFRTKEINDEMLKLPARNEKPKPKKPNPFSGPNQPLGDIIEQDEFPE